MFVGRRAGARTDGRCRSRGVSKARPRQATPGFRDTTTFAVGPRFHFKLADNIWFRPGMSLSLPIDDPMKKAEYKIVQLDLPISF